MVETYYRQIKVGDSEAMVGPRYIVAILRGFTPGEDAVMAWVSMQDSSRLVDIVPMGDGRDFVVFERQYTKQSFIDAYQEAERYQQAVVRLLSKQDDYRQEAG